MNEYPNFMVCVRLRHVTDTQQATLQTNLRTILIYERLEPSY